MGCIALLVLIIIVIIFSGIRFDELDDKITGLEKEINKRSKNV